MLYSPPTQQLSPTSTMPSFKAVYTTTCLEDIDTTTFLFREALALRPQRHSDYPSSL
jgi:hypothetical protein